MNRISPEAAALRAEIDGELGCGYPRAAVDSLTRPLKERIYEYIIAQRSYPAFVPLSWVCTDLGIDRRTLGRHLWSWAPTPASADATQTPAMPAPEAGPCQEPIAPMPQGISVTLPGAIQIAGLTRDDALALVDRVLAHVPAASTATSSTR